MPKRIIIEIPLDGEITVKTEGYSGRSCKDASKFIEDALGEVVSDVKTADYYRAETTSQQKEKA